MRWLTADIVFDGYDFHKDYFIQVDEEGSICKIRGEEPQTTFRKLSGLLMPGMVNAHCHLELSHTKGMIAKKTGLSTFLQNVSEVIPQKVSDDMVQQAVKQGDAEMLQNGIVLVGDICNTASSIRTKLESDIIYHSFIECIAIREKDVIKRFQEYRSTFGFFDRYLYASLSLHTPYTCHEELYKLVNRESSFISIHNQESEAENLLFERKNGSFDKFYEHFGLEKKEIIQQHTSTSSFENSMRLLKKDSQKLFVHNTFTRSEDLRFADHNTWFCFCPKANLYIENQLPNIPIFKLYQDRIVLGTDSLASNDSLNILSEIKTIQDHFPEIPVKHILQWATSNGAHLFGLEAQLGSFEVGKRPGFVHLEGFDTDNCTVLNATCSLIR